MRRSMMGERMLRIGADFCWRRHLPRRIHRALPYAGGGAPLGLFFEEGDWIGARLDCFFVHEGGGFWDVSFTFAAVCQDKTKSVGIAHSICYVAAMWYGVFNTLLAVV